MSEKTFCLKNIFVGEKISLKKNFIGEKISLLQKSFCQETNFVGKKICIRKKIFFENKFSDKRQKTQESDEIDQNLANKVTNLEGLMKLGDKLRGGFNMDCQWSNNGFRGY